MLQNRHITTNRITSSLCPQSRQTGEVMRSAARLKDSGCPANFLNRPQKFQQVGVDLICIRGGEPMRQAWVKISLAPLMSLTDFLPEISMGTIWSSSPCMTSVGTSNFLRSSWKSVSESRPQLDCDFQPLCSSVGGRCLGSFLEAECAQFWAQS